MTMGDDSSCDEKNLLKTAVIIIVIITANFPVWFSRNSEATETKGGSKREIVQQNQS